MIWQDLTVENAEEIKDFYSQVIGWQSSDVNQSGYNDFNIHNPADNNQVIAGICHKRGDLAKFPSQWLLYVAIEDINSSLEKCKALGGKIIDGPKAMGKAKFAVIQDPAGAYLALIQE